MFLNIFYLWKAAAPWIDELFKLNWTTFIYQLKIKFDCIHKDRLNKKKIFSNIDGAVHKNVKNNYFANRLRAVKLSVLKNGFRQLTK